MRNQRKVLSALCSIAIAGVSLLSPGFQQETTAASVKDVVVNEVAWMGTSASYSDEWIELYNNTNTAINMTGWTLKAQDGSPSIQLSGSIPANGYFLLEKTDDQTISDVTADQIYSGTLGNEAESLQIYDENNNLIDSVDSWHAGDNTTKGTMERIDSSIDGNSPTNWGTSTAVYSGGYGTPKAVNSVVKSVPSTTEQLHNVSDAPGAMNIYFNKSALTQYALAGNEANYNVNLENRLLKRLDEATTSIDFATYELNLPKVVDKLIEKAAQGLEVRVLADAKDARDPHYAERYETMRLYLEKMVRGQDMVIGTADDVRVFSDSPMFAIEDGAKRTAYGLPVNMADIPTETVQVGSQTVTGHMFVDGEEKAESSYYSPDTQMHNKFAVIDGKWIFTGSWNFTVTGLYGSEENMQQGILDGNQQHVVETNSPELASIYKTEFEEMWGSNTNEPNPVTANFSSRKMDNTPHVVTIGGKKVEVYFSAGDNAVGRMTELVKNEAQYNTYFTIFAWSDQALVDELKYKWEGSYNDMQGELTGFDVKGVFDSDFWNQWWSASVDMTGRTASQVSVNNPNTRWANPAPVYQDAETRKLHAKTMIIDADTSSDPTVVVGSTNWSENGNNINDENMLIIHDTSIVNQFVQEFNARYINAGGQIN
ncbi:phospholipase D-like domain-containing protein [Priestia abyssalis]|uniref:phospholipase D-like domain-containing protein n=1 Tax=Priestia abyssalis TaxID=1221450 RepID=UPI000995DDF4|nr:phospholipase D-like domain-containing protein [Priestia abyssalis]